MKTAQETLAQLGTPSRKRDAEVAESSPESDLDSDAPMIQRRRLDSTSSGRTSKCNGYKPEPPISVRLDQILGDAVKVSVSIKGLREAEESASKDLKEVHHKMVNHIETNVYSCAGLVSGEFLDMERSRKDNAAKLRKIADEKAFVERQVACAKQLCQQFLKRIES